ncbi:hypothetical protein JCM1841_001043 [Sporobolomyces salmonicolor]
MIVQLIFSVIPNMICLALYIKYLLLLRPLHFHIVDKTPGRTSSKSSGRSAMSKLSKRSGWSRHNSGGYFGEKDDFMARPMEPRSSRPRHTLQQQPLPPSSKSHDWPPHQQRTLLSPREGYGDTDCASSNSDSTDNTYTARSKPTPKPTLDYHNRARQPYTVNSTFSN